jgi:hypothetical protein
MDKGGAMSNVKTQSSKRKTIFTFNHFDIDLTFEL